MTITVPAQYSKDVADAASALGIPQQVVAAQIDLESSWDPTVTSSAGAEGIAQFEPGTFAEYGPKGGSPFNPGDAFTAYTAYMRALLHWAGGDVRKALAAYNAGQGNWQAGQGYASTILSRAGTGDITAGRTGITDTPAPSTGSSGGGLLSWPSEITGFFTSATSDVSKTMSWLSAFFQPSTYIRIGAGVLGAAALIAGLVCLGLAAQER